jgi:hypothetical protein
VENLNNKILTGLIIFILSLTIISALDVRPPMVSLNAISQANAGKDASLIIVASDIGYGNDGLSKVEIANENTGATVFSTSLNRDPIYSTGVSVNEVEGTYTYVLKVWDLSNNYAEARTQVTFLNNKPEVVVTPVDNRYVAGIVDINYDATDYDNDTLKVDIQYTTDGGKNWTTVAHDLDNTGSYALNTSQINDDNYVIRVVANDNKNQSASDLVDPQVTVSNAVPEIVVNSIDPLLISTGTVFINFTTSKPLSDDPAVTINGDDAVLENSSTRSFYYSYDLDDDDIDGYALVNISVNDIFNLTNSFATNDTLYIDQVGPLLVNATPSLNGSTKQTSLTLNADVSEHSGVNESTIMMTFNGTDYYTNSTQLKYSNGHLTFEMPSNLTGINTVTFYAEDILGNSETADWTITFDTVSPSILINSPSTGDVIITRNMTVNATVTESNNIDDVWAEIDSVRYNMTLVNGTDDYETSISVSNGAKTLTVYAEDEAGNTGSRSVSFTVSLDKAGPIINNTSPSLPSLVNDAAPEISADIFDSGSGIDDSTIVMTVGNETYNSSSSELSFDGTTVVLTPSSDLSDGLVNVMLTVADYEGNYAAKQWSFIIDATSPAVTITSPAHDSQQDSDVVVVFSIIESNLDYVQARINSGSWFNISKTVNGYAFNNLDLGSNDLSIRAFDLSGNSGTDTITVNVSLDSSTPEITFVSPIDYERVRTNVFDITVSVVDNIAVDSVKVTYASNSVDLTNTAGDEYSETLNLTNGNYVLTVIANDSSGNIEAKSLNIEVNNGTIDGIVSGTVTYPNGTPAFNADVSGYYYGRLTNSTSTGPDGTYSMSVEYGTITVNVTAPGYETDSSNVSITAGHTTTHNVQLKTLEDISVNSISYNGSSVEKQPITISAALSKAKSDSKNVNVSLYVNDELKETKQVSVTLTGTVSFAWIGEKGTNDIKISSSQVTGETDLMNNNKSSQITVSALDNVLELYISAPPYNLQSDTSYTVPVFVTNLGTETLANLPVDFALSSGLTLNDNAQKTITSLGAGNSTMITWSVKTGTADNSTSENIITASVYDIVTATDTVKSSAGHGFR